VYTRESEEYAQALFMAAIANEVVDPSRLTVHADRGSSMTSKTLAQLFADLGVTTSHSRPHVSNDNPYSEAHFKTLKYGPSYPRRFASLQQARAYCRQFIIWYNNEHRHSGIALLTPADVHFGRAAERQAARAAVLAQAWHAHPERFVRGCPRPPQLEPIAYINRPESASAA